MQSKLASALDLARRGYRVFPLVINGKTPAIEGNWRKIATTDPARVESMWRCPVLDTELDYNIGIALDRNTLVVDVDRRDGKRGFESLQLLEAIYEPLPPTVRSRTASGGEHLWFEANDSGAFANTLATDIDLKGEGGYVVAPGSEIDGRLYEWVGERGPGGNAPGIPGSPPDGALPHLARCPEWISHHAPAGRKRDRDALDHRDKTAVRSLDTQSAVSRAIEWLEHHAPDAVEGQGGDNTTIKVANYLGDLGLSPDVAADLMVDHWNDSKAIPPWDEDELRRKVASGFRSRQNAIGVRAPEAEFDAVEIDDKPPPRKGLYFTSWKASKPEADRPYLIDGVIETASMVVTYGDSNVGKSFVTLDQAYHIAAGKEWNGHKVRQGMVVYIASEGGTGFLKRIEAVKRRTGVTDIPFFLVPCPVDLFSDTGSTAALIKLVRQAEAESGQKCALVVVDTLARAMGGGDENTSTDMGKFVVNCDRIRAATGAAVNIVHHTGKDKARGARGSSALRAATDTEIEIAPGTMAMTKQRDGAMPDVMRFKLAVVEVGRREDGKAVTSCVVEWLAVNEFSDEVSPAAQEMLDVLERLTAARRDEIAEDETLSEVEREAAGDWVAWKTWEAECIARIKGPRGKPLKRTGLYPLRQELLDTNKIDKNKQNEWRFKGG